MSTALYSRAPTTLDQLAQHLSRHGWKEFAPQGALLKEWIDEGRKSRFFEDPDEEGMVEAWPDGEHIAATVRHNAMPDEAIWVCSDDPESAELTGDYDRINGEDESDPYLLHGIEWPEGDFGPRAVIAYVPAQVIDDAMEDEDSADGIKDWCVAGLAEYLGSEPLDSDDMECESYDG